MEFFLKKFSILFQQNVFRSHKILFRSHMLITSFSWKSIQWERNKYYVGSISFPQNVISFPAINNNFVPTKSYTMVMIKLYNYPIFCSHKKNDKILFRSQGILFDSHKRIYSGNYIIPFSFCSQIISWEWNDYSITT